MRHVNCPRMPEDYMKDVDEADGSGVNDIVVVLQDDGTYKSTPLQAYIGKYAHFKTLF